MYIFQFTLILIVIYPMGDYLVANLNQWSHIIILNIVTMIIFAIQFGSLDV